MPKFGRRRTIRRITVFRTFANRTYIPKNKTLMNVRSADMPVFAIPACLQNVESPYNWCIFEYEGETLFAKFSEGILKDTEREEYEWE